MLTQDDPAVWAVDTRAFSLPIQARRWRQAGLVSGQELDNAARYGFEQGKLQYLAGRALVRHALAHVARYQPAQVEIVLGEAGKPVLARTPDQAGWHFNISHSGHMVACGLGGAGIGIDIEMISRRIDHAAIAETYFSADEARWVTARPDRVKQRFVALWTIKEAYLKAIGVGLALPINGVLTTDIGLRSCRVLSHHVHDWKKWHCRLMQPAADFWLAVCYENAFAPLKLRWADL
ncbi:4'-phosphopantetheinyl transferase [Oxalobacteraceae bacterium GrIS 1.11]